MARAASRRAADDEIIRPRRSLSTRQLEILARLDELPDADMERLAAALVKLLISAYRQQEGQSHAT